MSSIIDQRFRESTRGRVITLLRAGNRTVDELAVELKLTDNAIRQHLTVLERDGLVRQLGVRRLGSVGKPAVMYEIHPDAEPLLSRAYAPVLSALLEVLTEELPARQAQRILREAGRRIARDLGGSAGEGSDLRSRARGAAAVLTALGAEVTVEEGRGVSTLRGAACPLAAAASRSPHTCAAIETLIAEISGTKVSECCDRSGRPRCCFELRNAG